MPFTPETDALHAATPPRNLSAPEGQPLHRRLQDRARGDLATLLEGVERAQPQLVPRPELEATVVRPSPVDVDPPALDPLDLGHTPTLPRGPAPPGTTELARRRRNRDDGMRNRFWASGRVAT